MKVTAEYLARDIRYGDKVSDSQGRTYIAMTDAEKDQFGDYNVLTDDNRYIAYTNSDIVTVEYMDSHSEAFEDIVSF